MRIISIHKVGQNSCNKGVEYTKPYEGKTYDLYPVNDYTSRKENEHGFHSSPVSRIINDTSFETIDKEIFVIEVLENLDKNVENKISN